MKNKYFYIQTIILRRISKLKKNKSGIDCWMGGFLAQQMNRGFKIEEFMKKVHNILYVELADKYYTGYYR